ncbi:MAG: hypothetical protein HQL25_02560 [Candidatus Omnitrophica bacterium]|nr:hypothetical protein [Candidatus Omnitrophota bacterium]
MKVLFLGNDGNLVQVISRMKNTVIVGIVADEVNLQERKIFGSSALFAKHKKIPFVSQEYFHKHYNRLILRQWKDVDVIFSQGYHYRILPELLSNARIKIVNFHQSLLPDYRGRHPLNWVIVNGEKKTGITFHYVNEGFDEGTIIVQKPITVSLSDDVISLYRKTIRAAEKILPDVFKKIADPDFIPRKQNLSAGRYFPVRKPEDGRINPEDSVAVVKNKIRALIYPYPGAFFEYEVKKIVVDQIKRINIKRRDGNQNFIYKNNGKFYLKLSDAVVVVQKIRKQKVYFKRTE